MKLYKYITFVLCQLSSLCIAQEIVSLAFVGDIMPGSTYYGQQTADRGQSLFNDAKKIFSTVDFTFGNLETTLADSGRPRNPQREFNFLTPTSYGRILKEAGIGYLSVANNHTYDFGAAGIASTLRILKKNDIYCSGLKQQDAYQLIEIKGIRIAVCAFGFNFYCNQINDLTEVKRIINSATKNADIVVVSFHGGAEGKQHRNLPQKSETFMGEDRGNLRRFAHFCIDNGADVVYGHGPHVVRAVEIYKDRIIAYSLGNFCTPYGISIGGINGYAPILTIELEQDGLFRQGRIHSMIQYRGVGPRFDPENRALKEIRLLSDDNISNGAMNITSTGHIIATRWRPIDNELIEESEEYYEDNEIDWNLTGW